MHLCNTGSFVQNELRQQNERMRLINQQVIAVDSRVSNAMFKMSSTQTQDNENSNINFEASGKQILFHFRLCDLLSFFYFFCHFYRRKIAGYCLKTKS